MKKIFKKFGLSLAAIACVVCAGFGIALGSSDKAQSANAAELTADNYYIVGTGVRLVNDANGSGIRFHTNLAVDAYSDVVSSGTLIIPEVRCDGELTLDDLNNAKQTRPAHVVTKDANVDLWYDAVYNDVAYKRTTAYLYDIPENAYGARMVAVSYVRYANGNVVYTPISPAVSMSDVATIAKNSAYVSEETKAQVAPYIVEDVTVKYNMPNGSVQTETVAYGSKLSGPTYDANVNAIASATDQYGNEINFASYEATLPVTIDIEFEAAKVVVADSAVTDTNNLTLSNNAAGVTAPAGYSSVTNLFSASGNTWPSKIFGESDFASQNLNAYSEVWFAIMIENGHFTQTAPTWTDIDSDSAKVWVEFHLIREAESTWTIEIYKDGTLWGTQTAQSGATIGSIFSTSNDGGRIVVYQKTDGTNSIADVNVYATEVRGIFDTGIKDNAATIWNHIWNPYYFTGGGSPEGAYSDEEAPAGFSYVSEYTCSTKDFGGKYGHVNAADISGYSDLWYAMKVVNVTENGDAYIYLQGAPSNGYMGSEWVYVHYHNNGDGTWTKDYRTVDGYYSSATNHNTGITGTKLTDIVGWKSGVNQGSYPTATTGNTYTAYFTNVIALKLDGSAIESPTPPSSGSTDFDPEIPYNAIAVRHYPWRDDRYTTGTNEVLTEGAPEGFSSVLKHTWKADRTSEYTYCFDTTLDITKFSDLYLATKQENGTHIYIRNSGGHYATGGWLYAHYTQVSTGVWSVSYRAADGYSKDIAQTISATNLKTLIDGNLYGHAESAGMGTITYWTEILGVSAVQDERVIFSAVDGAIKTDDAVGAPAGFTSVYKYENFTEDKFASLDLSNTKYDTISFGMIADKDFTFKAGYKYTMPEEAEERPTTSIMYNTSSYPQMYKVNLTNNRNGSWTVTMNVKRWVSAPAAGGSSAQIADTETFTATVTGNSLQTIMQTILTPAKGMTLYVTEVRGTHTCASSIIISLGNGQLQEVCATCGKPMADPVDFAHGIDPEATEVNDSIWRDNNYALSTPDQEAPAGFNNIEMYRWNYNSVIVNGVPYGSTNKDMSLTCLDEANISAYDEVWFAMKNVGGTGFYVRNGSKYEGEDWLYFHLVKVDDAWTLSLSSPDGYVATNVQTGIVGNTLKDILQYHASTVEQPWNSGAYPTKAEGDTTTDVKIYFTEILGIIGCEHTAVEYVSNGDGTHNEVCGSCGKVLNANVACAGGNVTCTSAPVCSLCNEEYGKALGHRNVTWNWGVATCGVCGEIADRAETVAPSAIVDSDANAHLTPANNEAGVTAPTGFSSVTNFFSASGNTWASKILASQDYAAADLSAYKEVWFAIALQNGHFTNTADGWKNLDADASLVWIKFHMVQTSTDVWTVSIYVADALYKTFENRPGDTIYELTENNNNGLRLVIYQLTDGTNSIADVNVYATEIMGVFDNGISEYATNVWDHIWNTYYFTGGGSPEGAYSNVAAPEGFSKVSESTCSTKDFAGRYGHLNAADISAYSDLWYAMKVVNVTDNGDAYIYIQGGNPYTGGDWVYVHYHHNSDGTWTKDYRTVDGYFNNTSQTSGNITGTKLTDMVGWKSGVNQGSYPSATTGNTYTAYFTNVIGVLKCTGEHGEDKIVANGDGTHDVFCRCGQVVRDNVPCSGGEATCQSGAICLSCGTEYTDVADHKGGTATCTSAPICTVCGEEYGEKLEHTGGEATCAAQAVCSICGQSYGDKLPHNTVFEDGAVLGHCSVCGEGVLNIIPTYATKVWDHIWNSYYFTGGGAAEGAYADGVAAPDGFSKVSYYDFTDRNFPKTGHLNNSTTISNYCDLYFAMKVVNGSDIYLQGCPNAAQGYTGGNWLYVHMHQANDGTWSKDFYAVDGFEFKGVQKGLTGTTLPALMTWVSGVNTGSYPRALEGGATTATAYFTDVVGVLKCDGSNHTEDKMVSNGDGTHNVVCRCGAVITANVACTGGEATCTDKAVCSGCNAPYGSALGHNGEWTVNDEYYCNRCDTNLGTVNTNLSKQTVALFTNASSITANAETPLSVNLSSATTLTMNLVSVKLNGNDYVGTLEDNVVTINVLPNKIFGECTLEVKVSVEGKEFTITVPVLVVTNMITNAQGMLDMKYVLRGKTNEAKVADTANQNENVVIYRGGAGGASTMNGDGYYMLGDNVSLVADGGGYTDVYVWGTKVIPFVGTFDGNGHVINNFVKTNWFSGHVLEDTSVTGSYANELEGSLFGVVNGTVKNVAFTNVQLGIFANIVLDGTGYFEDVYVEITNLQHNANVYVAPFFWRNTDTVHGEMKNVVFNFNKIDASTIATASTRYPAALGKYFTADNVAVYGFDTTWVNGDRGNVYYTDTAVDGSAYNIYVKYKSGTENGASFMKVALSDDIWKIVDGIPYLKNVEVSGEATNPSDSNDAVAPEGGAEYSLVWMGSGLAAYEPAQFIKETTNAAVGGTLGINAANLSGANWSDTKQIIVGSYDAYGDYVSAELTDNDDYGVYTVGETIFVLAETDEGLMFAAQELCRRLYGWNQYTYLAYDAEAISFNSIDKIDSDNVGNYTTSIAFAQRSPANDYGLDTAGKTDMGFMPGTPYTYLVSMHNSMNYFGETSSDEEAAHEDTTAMTAWSTWNSTSYPNATIDYAFADSDTQLCYLGHGNKATFEAMVDHVVKIIKGKKAAVPAMKIINFMVEDNKDHCTCTACSKFSNPAVTQLLFVNAVQKKLNTDGVNVGIEYFAYNAYSPAPVILSSEEANLTSIANDLGLTSDLYQTVTVTYDAPKDKDGNDIGLQASGYYTANTAKVLKAVEGSRLWWTSHEANHSFELEHVANAHMYLALQAWIAAVGGENIDVFMYQASYRNYFFPLNTWKYQILWYQSLNSLGVNSYMFNLGDVHNNADKQTAFSAFKTYIDSRAQKDLNVTFEQLKDEFFGVNGYYGAGGPTMRTFFEELVSVYESHKQDEEKQFVATTAFADNTNTLGISDNGGYIANWWLNDFNHSSNPNYYSYARQGFFNGSYGWNLTSMVFGTRSSSYSNVAPSTNVFVYGTKTQLQTLEGWYTYCQTALSQVGEGSKYAKRIQLEALMPEYMYLTYHSTYTMGTSSSSPNVTSNFPSSSDVFTTTSYQDFYNRVDALGMLKPSEFYGFHAGGDVQATYEKQTLGWSYRYMYENMFKNWKVTVS